MSCSSASVIKCYVLHLVQRINNKINQTALIAKQSQCSGGFRCQVGVPSGCYSIQVSPDPAHFLVTPPHSPVSLLNAS